MCFKGILKFSGMELQIRHDIYELDTQEMALFLQSKTNIEGA